MDPSFRICWSGGYNSRIKFCNILCSPSLCLWLPPYWIRPKRHLCDRVRIFQQRRARPFVHDQDLFRRGLFVLHSLQMHQRWRSLSHVWRLSPGRSAVQSSFFSSQCKEKWNSPALHNSCCFFHLFPRRFCITLPPPSINIAWQQSLERYVESLCRSSSA